MNPVLAGFYELHDNEVLLAETYCFKYLSADLTNFVESFNESSTNNTVKIPILSNSIKCIICDNDAFYCCFSCSFQVNFALNMCDHCFIDHVKFLGQENHPLRY
jgi:hypothetical protein